MYPGEEFGVPEDVSSDYMRILIVASATQTGVIEGKRLDDRIHLLADTLQRLFRKHLSDGAETFDKKRFSIELLETALAIAKGEVVL